MRKNYIYFVFLMILLQLLLTSCGPGTEEGLGFETLEEFKNNFKDFCAFPTYIPFGLDNSNKGMLSAAAGYNGKGFKLRHTFIDNPKKKYNRNDIFSSICLSYYNIQNYNENDKFRLANVASSLMLEFNQQEANNLEIIRYNNYVVYYDEIIDSELVHSNKTYLDSNTLYLDYYMNFDDSFYLFSFSYSISKDVDKETLLKLRDELKAICLEEAIKTYESLEYEK